MDVYLEEGAKKVFAGAIDWPGWCRGAKKEAAALQALFDYAPRYGAAVKRLGFKAPADYSELKIIERLKGNATTDFGAPDAAPSSDADMPDKEQLERMIQIWKASWATFDAAVEKGGNKQLKTGPRGGGRTVAKMTEHVLGAEAAYLSSLGMQDRSQKPEGRKQLEKAVIAALRWRAAGNQAEMGRRKNPFWTPGFFVRRSAWHLLDHAWEIEDRLP